MSTVGIFAGRGDVIIAMALSAGIGLYVGWWLRGKGYQLVGWFERKFKKS